MNCLWETKRKFNWKAILNFEIYKTSDLQLINVVIIE